MALLQIQPKAWNNLLANFNLFSSECFYPFHDNYIPHLHFQFSYFYLNFQQLWFNMLANVRV